MLDLNDLTITEICRPTTIFSKKGKFLSQSCRSSCALSFCLGGMIEYHCNGKTILSDETSVIFLPKNACYTLHGLADGNFPLINFQCLGEVGEQILRFPVKDVSKCLRLFEKINALYLYQGSRPEIFSCFYQLINRIRLEQNPFSRKLRKATDYIESKISDPALCNGDIAAFLGISEVYLRKLFSEVHHTTPKQFILNYRINRAKQLLHDTDLSVSEIAESCGFTCVYHFSRSFKSKVGKSASDFAKESRAMDEEFYGTE